MTPERLHELSQRLAKASPVDIMDAALSETPGPASGIACSGAEDVLLIEYAQQTRRPFQVFALDTGRLHPETYELFARIESHYQLRIQVMMPQAEAVEKLVNAKGLFSFRQDGHQECCGIRKVEPLRRKLSTLDAWITGQRRDQSTTRAHVPVVHIDPAFRGRDEGQLVKWNPLADVSSQDVWNVIRALEIPYNPLHAQGYVSIGCAPCTRPVLPGQHEREGRWWWEDASGKECGLHKGNLKPS